ncbi:MAG: zf-HC2 domain-containing protein [Oscillospiraceae bacterium]|nr:zf-HC2 domain-containing protein [Oscillospiraceae bacterium]
MNGISCDICLDLMPLVWDEVASEDSRKAVLAHIGCCENCRAAFEKHDVLPSPDDGKVLKKIRRQLTCGALLVMVLGAMIGVSFSESQDLFYNILIMPAIGGLGVLVLREKGLLTPLLPAAIFFLQKSFAIMHGAAPEESLATALFWSLLYGGFCLAGGLAVMLLQYAFRKEKKHEEK